MLSGNSRIERANLHSVLREKRSYASRARTRKFTVTSHAHDARLLFICVLVYSALLWPTILNPIVYALCACAPVCARFTPLWYLLNIIRAPNRCKASIVHHAKRLTHNIMVNIASSPSRLTNMAVATHSATNRRTHTPQAVCRRSALL